MRIIPCVVALCLIATAPAPTEKMTAHIATSDERARLWPLVIADHKNYAGYQNKTDREIPLVVLEPAAQS